MDVEVDGFSYVRRSRLEETEKVLTWVLKHCGYTTWTGHWQQRLREASPLLRASIVAVIEDLPIPETEGKQ